MMKSKKPLKARRPLGRPRITQEACSYCGSSEGTPCAYPELPYQTEYCMRDEEAVGEAHTHREYLRPGELLRLHTTRILKEFLDKSKLW